MTDNAAPGATGGDSGGDAAAQQAAADAAAQAAAAGGDAGAGDANAADAAKGDEASKLNDPTWVAAEFARLRAENAKQRVGAKAAAAAEAKSELLATLTAALDPEAAAKGQQLTIEQASEQLTATSTERDAAIRETAIVREAWKLGVDPAKLDYLQFTLSRNADIANADVADGAALGGMLNAAIAEAITKDSTLKLSGAAIGSGVDQHGGAGASATITKSDWDSMNYVQRLALYNENRAEYDRLVNS